MSHITHPLTFSDRNAASRDSPAIKQAQNTQVSDACYGASHGVKAHGTAAQGA
jgi:hypothetical protein